jgi:AraC family transcriptional regulator of adaptative response / DNA-3-methyladenine glycosylase II
VETEYDEEHWFRAMQSRDSRFDGWVFVAVTSTGIYCRPSCPAVTPKRRNVRFYPSAAAAQRAGFRACMRCRPDAAPGSPAWDMRADVVARAMKLIADGVVDREGVRGLAGRLGYSERQLHRQLLAEVGTGAVALARAQRAQTARVLIETTELPMAHVAFAAGFSSIRQFNDTVREIFAMTPSRIRQRAARRRPELAAGSIGLRLACRTPFDGRHLLAFLGARALPGVEAVDGATYRRSLALPHSEATVALTAHADHVWAVFELADLRDLTTAVSRCRRLLDLNADPVAVDETLGADAVLGPLVRRSPGLRVPGTVDGAELAVRAVLGQQVSVAAARTAAGRLVACLGPPLERPGTHVTRLFPPPERIAGAGADALAMPAARRRTVTELARALAERSLIIDAGADRQELRAQLVSQAGIGAWTADYIAMRALGDPDVLLASDLGVRRALGAPGAPVSPAEVVGRAQSWRPWRSYATAHLWSGPPPTRAAGADDHASSPTARPPEEKDTAA